MRTVCCVMLANGREAMVRRALRSWLEQTYPESHRFLLILDTGALSLVDTAQAHANVSRGLIHVPRYAMNGQTIGALRNDANRRTNAEVIVHWDSDDWSHPRRIEEQVALLEASGKEAVGYRDMLFWRYPAAAQEHVTNERGEAWLYTNRVPTYALGTSLCYWRSVWQGRPFADTSAGEDTRWLMEVKSQGAASVLNRVDDAGAPRMIASIHGANTYAKIEPRAEEWKRVTEWDDHCREVMAL